MAEGTSLLRMHTAYTCIVSSNLTVSARKKRESSREGAFFSSFIGGNQKTTSNDVPQYPASSSDAWGVEWWVQPMSRRVNHLSVVLIKSLS